MCYTLAKEIHPVMPSLADLMKYLHNLKVSLYKIPIMIDVTSVFSAYRVIWPHKSYFFIQDLAE